MVVYEKLDNLPLINSSSLTIGSFDGIHVGHLEILKKLIQLSSSSNSTSVVITFNPHPRSILSPKIFKKNIMITSLVKKIEIFKSIGIDIVLVLPFNKNLSLMTADNFLEKIIIKKFKPKDIVIGYDHHFGYKRAGNSLFLEKKSKKFNFQLHQIDKQSKNGYKISSSLIRQMLNTDNIEIVNSLLGWNYELKGTIIKGKGIGKTIGFPTANINPVDKNQIIPKNGVYFINIKINTQTYSGMCNIGLRPTVKGKDLSIEVNIFTEKNINIYGKTVSVIFLNYLRNEIDFQTINKLKEQLIKDKNNCIKIESNSKGE